jgi:hypothetical protein
MDAFVPLAKRWIELLRPSAAGRETDESAFFEVRHVQASMNYLIEGA